MIYINIAPCLFDFGFYKIQFYGLVAVIGIIVFYFCIIFDKKKPKNITSDFLLQTLTESLLVGIFSSRILFVLENYNFFLNLSAKDVLLHFFTMSNGGFSMLGSMIGIPVYIYLKSFFLNINFWELADLLSKNAPVFQMISRFGCLGVGCCAGIEVMTNSFFSVVYLHPDAWAPLNTALLPNPLLSIIFSIFIYVFLNFIDISFFKKAGTRFALYLVLESFARFTVDFWRIYSDRTMFFKNDYFNLSFNQIVSNIIFLAGIIIFKNLYSKKNIENNAESIIKKK